MKQKEKHNTIGLDLGEGRHRFCVLDEAGEVVEQGSLSNERAVLGRLTQRYRAQTGRSALKPVEKPQSL
jgi:hypothetical protein